MGNFQYPTDTPRRRRRGHERLHLVDTPATVPAATGESLIGQEAFLYQTGNGSYIAISPTSSPQVKAQLRAERVPLHRSA